MSQFGDAVYGLLFIFMADKLTKDSAFVGAVGAAAALPFLLLGPVAGVAADRLDRKLLMLGADYASTVVLLLFAGVVVVVGSVPKESLIAVPFLLSCINAFFMPAKGAAVPALVPGEALLEANSLSSATQTMMQTVGLLLAGILLGPLEKLSGSMFFLVAILVNAATFLVSALFIRKLPAIKPDRDHEETGKWKHDLAEGLRAITHHPALKPMFISSIFVHIAISGFMVIYTASNRQWYDGSFMTLTWIELSFMVPMVAASIWVGQLAVKRVGVAYCVSLAAIGIALAFMGFGEGRMWLFIAMNVLAGVLLPFAQIPMMTFTSLAVQDGVRGRVTSVWTMLSMGVQPLGIALTGLTLGMLGLVNLYVAMGMLIMVTMLAAMLSRGMREATMPETSTGQPKTASESL